MKILNFLISQKPANLHIKINGKYFLKVHDAKRNFLNLKNFDVNKV